MQNENGFFYFAAYITKLGKCTIRNTEAIIVGKYNLTISITQCNYVSNEKVWNAGYDKH